VNEAVYEAANYLDELAALSSSADDTALTAPALPRRRPSILYAPRGHAAPPKDPATAAAAIQSSPRMDDQGGITPVMTPVMTPVIVRSDAPSYRYDARAVLSTRLTHRVGTVSGAVVSAISRIRRVTGVATRRTLWSSGPRWGAVTVNGPEGASAAGVAVTVNGPEGASAAGGHADHTDTGLSGDPSGARDGAPTSARDGAQPVPETAHCQTQVCPATRWRSWWRCQRGVTDTERRITSYQPS
jgi:hypothetical protein